MSNKMEEKMDEEVSSWDVRKMISVYLHEFFEAFVAILIIRMAMDKEIIFLKLLQASAVIGFVTFMLENYSSDFKSNIKQGITFSVGSQMVSTFMN